MASDAQGVVRDITGGSHCSYSSVLHEIARRRSMFEEVTFVYEGCVPNGEAHLLARYSVNLDSGWHVWLMEPSDPFIVPKTLCY